MSISPVQSVYANNNINNPGFNGLVKVEQHKDYEVRTYQNEATTGKKIGVGIASALINGLGQAINGEWGKACAFLFGGIIGSNLAKAIAGNVGRFIASFCITWWCVSDAIKNAKSKYVQIVPKNQEVNTENK